MSEQVDALRGWLFRSLMFEADSDEFREAGVRVGVDEAQAEEELLTQALSPFSLHLRQDALRMARLYAIIYCFENSVRDLITTRLGNVDKDWWNTLVPSKVRTSANGRLESAKKNSWLDGVNTDPLSFVDFGGLSDIVIKEWAEFEDLIPSQHWLKQRFDELEKARNYIAHNRMLSADEFSRLEMYVADWNRQIGL